MFKKLKDKIAEEVKSSPQRIQQLTQSVTERLQSATNGENVFTLGDDDTAASNTSLDGGFTDVSLRTPTPIDHHKTRRLSSSSMASDMSFLPQYEPSANLYSMQSDLDVSASEVEDNASMSSQPGHVTKEQVYAAFQKAQMRYHKYRGRYSDMLNHYRLLEKENAKIKAILVETQDKAIRRVSELREQCSLEQKAKAHLENALRVELDERQIKIDTLETKIKLLKNGVELPVETPLSSDTRPTENLETLSRHLSDARTEIEKLNEKLQETKAITIIFNTKEAEYKQRIKDLEKSLQDKTAEHAQVCEREKEASLKLAQIKMDLHLELHNRDLEISNLKQQHAGGVKLENLQSQNTKLIEKVEVLAQKCQNYESELIKLEQYKIENSNLSETIANLKKVNEEADVQELDRLRIYEETVENHTAILSENEKLRSELTELQEVLQCSEGKLRENENLKTKLEKLRSKLQESEILALQVQDSEEKLEAVRLEYEEKIKQMRESARTGLISLESKIKDKIIGEYDAREAKLKDEFQQKLQRLTESENDTKITQVKLMECQEVVSNLEKQLQEVQGNLANERARYLELENNHLELIEESAKTRSALALLEREIIDKNVQLNLVEDEVLKLTSGSSKLREKLDDMRAENVKLQSEIALMQDVSTQQQNKNCELQETIQQVIREIGDLTLLNQRLAEEKQSLLKKEEENAEFRKQIQEISAKNSGLEMDLEKLRNLLEENSENTKRESECQIRQFEEEASKCKLQLNERQSEIVSLQGTIADLHSEIQALKKEENRLKQNIEELKEVVCESEKELSMMKQTMTQTEEKFSNLNLQQGDILISLTNLEQQHKKLQQENALLVSKKQEQATLLEMMQTYEKELIKENAKLKSEYEEAQQKHKDIEEKLSETAKHVTEQNKKLSSKLNEVQKESEGNLVANKHLREELSNLRMVQTKLKTMEQANQKLIEDITTLQSQINDKIQETQILEEKLSKSQQHQMKYDDLLSEYTSIKTSLSQTTTELEELLKRNQQLSADYKHILDENEKNVAEFEAFRLKHEATEQELRDFSELKLKLEMENQVVSNRLEQAELHLQSLETERHKQDVNLEGAENQTVSLQNQITELELIKSKYESVCDENKLNKCESDHLKEQLRDKEALQTQIKELERHYNEIEHERQLLKDEIQELKISPVNCNDVLQEKNVKEIATLRDRLDQYKSLDKANRASIEFYENELQKSKVKNEKLNRKLDETLVTLPTLKNENHELGDSAAVLEYLRNVLFNYMTGKESLVLAKVIAAVCKFDRHQTELIIQREQQKQTLLGHLFGS